MEVCPLLVVGFPTGPLRANCYLVALGRNRDCVVIDPGQDSEAALSEALVSHGLKPVHILLTHGHYDHSAGAPALASEHRIAIGVHAGDRELLNEQEADFSAVTELSRRVFSFAGLQITMVPTPGHTKGSVTFLFDNPEGAKLAFTGDTLFAGSIGRTEFPGGDADQLRRSLRQQIVRLPRETVVLPGHGPATTVGIECQGNPFLAAVTAEAESLTETTG